MQCKHPQQGARGSLWRPLHSSDRNPGPCLMSPPYDINPKIYKLCFIIGQPLTLHIFKPMAHRTRATPPWALRKNLLRGGNVRRQGASVPRSPLARLALAPVLGEVALVLIAPRARVHGGLVLMWIEKSMPSSKRASINSKQRIWLRPSAKLLAKRHATRRLAQA